MEGKKMEERGLARREELGRELPALPSPPVSPIQFFLLRFPYLFALGTQAVYGVLRPFLAPEPNVDHGQSIEGLWSHRLVTEVGRDSDIPTNRALPTIPTHPDTHTHTAPPPPPPPHNPLEPIVSCWSWISKDYVRMIFRNERGPGDEDAS